MRYKDDIANQLVTDPDCITWRIYQTVDEYDINENRKHGVLNANGVDSTFLG
jgi:hypothetical protein